MSRSRLKWSNPAAWTRDLLHGQGGLIFFWLNENSGGATWFRSFGGTIPRRPRRTSPETNQGWDRREISVAQAWMSPLVTWLESTTLEKIMEMTHTRKLCLIYHSKFKSRNENTISFPLTKIYMTWIARIIKHCNDSNFSCIWTVEVGLRPILARERLHPP